MFREIRGKKGFEATGSYYRPFNMELAFEKKMIGLQHQAALNIQPFNQQLENFGSFGLQVVYINALKNQ